MEFITKFSGSGFQVLMASIIDNIFRDGLLSMKGANIFFSLLSDILDITKEHLIFVEPLIKQITLSNIFDITENNNY